METTDIGQEKPLTNISQYFNCSTKDKALEQTLTQAYTLGSKWWSEKVPQKPGMPQMLLNFVL